MSKDAVCQRSSSSICNLKDSFTEMKKGTDKKNQYGQDDKQKLSYWKTDSSEPLINFTIGRLLEQAVAQYPNRTAVSLFGDESLTYAEVLEKVDTLAAALVNVGLEKGDHVAIWGFNSVEWYLSFLAVVRGGFVAVNLSPLYESFEMLGCLKGSDVKALIMDEKLNDRNFYHVLKIIVPEMEDHDYNTHITNKNVPLLKTVIMLCDKPYRGTFKWGDLLASVTNDQKAFIKANQSQIGIHDVTNIQFTSGTTSHPKGVILTHYTMTQAPHLVGKYLGLYKKHHRVCLQVPLFHAYGTISGIICSILTGSTLIFPSRKFSPNTSIDCIIKEKCTVVHGTTTMYTDLLTVSEKRAKSDPDLFNKMSSIKIFHTGGAMCLPEMIIQLKKCFKNAKFLTGYGMTETSTTVVMSMPEDSFEVVLSTLGRVVDHVEVKVVDENYKMVPLGTPGEICFRGPSVMKEYYNEPEKTRAVLTSDGWLRSGDKFILLENGYTQIVGRIKDIIIRGGENIEPKEIEELISRHPDVIDVQVYGVDDFRLGEEVAAAIVKKENSNLSEQDVQIYCQGMISSYKIPQYIIFVEEFPKTASGKVQKFKLKEMTERLKQAKPV